MKILSVILAISISFSVSIYSFTLTTNSGISLNLNNYRNKKILIVNIAASGDGVTQIAELEQFYRKHKDSVLVLAFPTNSFGNTPQNNNVIRNFLNAQGVTFPVMNKTDVTGSQAHPLYKWLASDTSNGFEKIQITEDFQKILIGKKGRIRGVFSSAIRPGNAHLTNAMNPN
jgi:glutathione peroxidase